MSFLTRLGESWPINDWGDLSVVVAVSGGADSVALLCGLHELRAKEASGGLIAAHFNHRLRAGAEHDAQFVQQICQRLGVRCAVGVAEESIKEGADDGVEAAARVARYGFLLKTAEQAGARYVATAHTADDQAETVLHRVLRGTGIAGLAGIPRARQLSEAVTLIRPLLDFTRGEVVEYLAARHQTYCIDESNEDPSYTRNRIRHALLPQLAAQYNPNVRAALVRLGQLAGEAQQVIDQRVAAVAQKAVQIDSADQVTVACKSLKKEPPYLIRELLIQIWKQQAWPLQQMGHAEWHALAELVAAKSSKHPSSLNLPGNIRASKEADQLQLTRLRDG